MKKLFLILFAASISLSISAQEKTKQKEIGISFKSLNNFGMTYKIGNEKSLWRFNTLLMSGSNINEFSDSVETQRNRIGFDIMLGKEYRKSIGENLELRYGADISFWF